METQMEDKPTLEEFILTCRRQAWEDRMHKWADDWVAVMMNPVHSQGAANTVDGELRRLMDVYSVIKVTNV